MFAKIKALTYKASHSYRALPEKKQYIEFFTAALSVPMLLTVILINLNNLKTVKQPVATTNPTPVKQIIYVTPENNDDDKNDKPKPTQEEATACIEELPEVTISSPQEGEIVTDNPANVVIKQEKGDYCTIVWAYRINNGKWSEYDDKSIALYNLPNSTINFELRVKSIATTQEQIIKRSFTYNGSANTESNSSASESAN